jgi:hypothetical protein
MASSRSPARWQAATKKRHAEDCVEHITGVSDVTNNLRVNKQDDRHDVSRLVTPSVVPEPPTR